jgi:hypothetical protein
LESNTIFTPISTRGERISIYEAVIASETSVACQLPGKNLLNLRPVALMGGAMKAVAVESTEIKGVHKVIATFTQWKENFFLKTKLEGVGRGNFLLSLDAELYKLQRRDAFRVPLPKKYKAKVSIHRVNGTKYHKSLKIANLSSGGFAIDVEPPDVFDFEAKDVLLCNIEIKDKLDKRVMAEIRYKQQLGSCGSGLVRYGVKFIGFSEGDIAEVTKVAMEVYREAFAKFS